MLDLRNDNAVLYLLKIIEDKFVKIEKGKGLVSIQLIKQLAEDVKTLEERVDQLAAGGQYDVYDGSYTVTPKTTQQTLETNNMLMNDDVTVYEIPYFETGNNSGGNTVYIGSEIGNGG